MGAVQMDHVDPGPQAPLGSPSKIPDHPLDVGLRHRPRDRTGIHGRAGDGRRADRLAVVGGGRRLAAAVVQLHRQLAAVLVNGVGDPGQAGDDVVAVAADLIGVATALGRDVGRFELDEGSTALGAFAGVGDIALVQGAIEVGHGLLHRTGDEAVAHRHAVDASRT